MERMRIGSLFDGSGTAPLAATMLGWEPVWASEIEPFPVAVTRARFPDTKHLGNITEIDGAEIEPVDVIVGGSPCQDLSVAGKQSGLEAGTRSNMFYEMTRIVREMRGATNGKYPRFVVWENVPGAFSSNKGRDFLSVVEAFCALADNDAHIHRPTEDKTGRLIWKNAGTVLGDGWSFAWRILDAQYWGVPQRRRRIFAVLDLGSERAGEILFERTGVPRDSEPSGEAGEGTTADVVGRADRGGGVRCLNPHDSQTMCVYDADGIYPALAANSGGGQNRQAVVYAIDALSSNSMKSSNPNSGFHEENYVKCLDTSDCNPCKNQGGDVIVQSMPDVVYPVGAGTEGTDRADSSPCIDRWQPFVAMFSSGQGEKARSIGYSEDAAPTLRTTLAGGNAIPQTVYALQGNGIDRSLTAGCNGAGWREGEMYTLNTIDRPAVVYSIDQQGGKGAANYDENVMCTILSNSHGTPHAVVYDAQGNGDGDVAATITGDHQNRITDYTNIAVKENDSPKLYAMQAFEDYEDAGVASAQLSRQYKDATDIIVQEAKGEKECEYGTKPETNADKILQALWEEVGAKKVAEWGFRILNSFQQKGVLRPCLHDKSVSDGGNGVNKVDSPAPNEPQEKAERELRGVRSEKCARRTPQRWEPSEQQLGEFTAHLQELSQQDSSAEGVLHHMWEANERAWLLRKALSEIQKAREPICNKNQPIQRRYIIRRLLPVECARLQGFPNWWVDGIAVPNPTDEDIAFWAEVWETHRKVMNPEGKPKTRKQIVKWLHDPGSDSNKYKMWGNGMALPCMLAVLRAVDQLDKEEA